MDGARRRRPDDPPSTEEILALQGADIENCQIGGRIAHTWLHPGGPNDLRRLRTCFVEQAPAHQI